MLKFKLRIPFSSYHVVILTSAMTYLMLVRDTHYGHLPRYRCGWGGEVKEIVWSITIRDY